MHKEVGTCTEIFLISLVVFMPNISTVIMLWPIQNEAAALEFERSPEATYFAISRITHFLCFGEIALFESIAFPRHFVFAESIFCCL